MLCTLVVILRFNRMLLSRLWFVDLCAQVALFALWVLLGCCCTFCSAYNLDLFVIDTAFDLRVTGFRWLFGFSLDF